MFRPHKQAKGLFMTDVIFVERRKKREIDICQIEIEREWERWRKRYSQVKSV